MIEHEYNGDTYCNVPCEVLAINYNPDSVTVEITVGNAREQFTVPHDKMRDCEIIEMDWNFLQINKEWMNDLEMRAINEYNNSEGVK